MNTQDSYLHAYMRARKKALLLALILAGMCAAVLALCHVPTAPILYAYALCAVIGAAAAAIDFYHYRQRCRLLEGLREEICLSAEHLPESWDGISAAYDELLRVLFAEKRILEEQFRKRETEMTEYYTMWVHQIKTPIAAMRLALREREDGDALSLLADLNRIEQYVEMALCYLRLDAGTTDLCIAEYDLDGIVRQAVRRLASSFIGKGISLAYEPLDYRVLTDEKWLLFVVEQVLSNALKYTQAGRVEIALESEALVIRDTGIGIAPEDLPRIFEKGFTGYNGRADQKASGIGLYLCRRICGNLGHRIWAESTPDEGTAVYIGLARERPEAE